MKKKCIFKIYNEIKYNTLKDNIKQESVNDSDILFHNDIHVIHWKEKVIDCIYFISNKIKIMSRKKLKFLQCYHFDFDI